MSLGNHPWRFLGAFVLSLLATFPLFAQGEASIWSSAVDGPPTQPDLLPVGGSGQVNGGFSLATFFDPATGTAIQIGLRGQERFAGLLIQDGSVYFADTGSSFSGSGLEGAKWNYDLHLDFGTLEEDMLPENDIDPMPEEASLEKTLRTAGLLGVADQLTSLDMRGFDVELQVDIDPSGATDFIATDLNAAVDPSTVPSIRLFQTSQNLLFAVFGGGSGVFDPAVAGLYDFRLIVRDAATGSVVVSTAIQVAVGAATMDTVDVGLAIVEAADPVVVDETTVETTHTVTVTNHSPATAAADVTVSDMLTLPAGVEVTMTAPTAGVLGGMAPDLLWTLGSLAAGASETLTITLSVDTTAAVGASIGHVAVVTSSTPDRNLGNNSAVETTTVDCADGDADGVCNRDDNCPASANPDQLDSDGDGNGNACDLCAGDDALGDLDGDGLCEDLDFCFGLEASGDADMDGVCANLDCDDSDPTNVCAVVFADGFESSDLTSWSSSVGLAP